MLDGSKSSIEISIHALLAESDWSNRPVTMHTWKFLSTLSLRRATWPGLLARPFFIISIHALLAESDCNFSQNRHPLHNFYPRSPCGERRMTHTQKFCVSTFLSTLSLRRATLKIPLHCLAIHNFYPRSPCGERRNFSQNRHPLHNFYPRSPCGERQRFHAADISTRRISIHALLAESDCMTHTQKFCVSTFLSTLSLRRATMIHLLL